MKYLTVKEAAEKLGLNERTIRKYCVNGNIEGAFLNGKSWIIPENAKIVDLKSKNSEEYGIAREVLDYIDASPVNFYAAKNVEDTLVKNGFIKCYENKPFTAKPGDKIFFTRNDTSVLAFAIGKNVDSTNIGYHIIASHSDSPTFKLKPVCDGKTDSYNKVNVEPYGGMICSTWLDRPLSVAGRALVKVDNKIVSKLVNIDRDLLMIPNMCIHYNRTVNTGYAFNMATDMQPFFAEALKDTPFKTLLAKELGVSSDDILNFDLYLYNRQKAIIWGENNEYISSGRIDDQECVFTSLKAFVDASNDNSINVLYISDNEEVGSSSRQGADADFMDKITSRVSKALGVDDVSIARANSFMISADNGHAVHPNNPGVTDANNRCYMNKGIAIKFNASQSYTSDAISSSIFQSICQSVDSPYQFFTNRSDMRGGSTLGNISLTHLSVYSVDIGLPQLAMHSSYETAGTKDIYYAYKAFKKFYSSSIIIEDGAFEIK